MLFLEHCYMILIYKILQISRCSQETSSKQWQQHSWVHHFIPRWPRIAAKCQVAVVPQISSRLRGALACCPSSRMHNDHWANRRRSPLAAGTRSSGWCWCPSKRGSYASMHQDHQDPTQAPGRKFRFLTEKRDKCRSFLKVLGSKWNTWNLLAVLFLICSCPSYDFGFWFHGWHDFDLGKRFSYQGRRSVEGSPGTSHNTNLLACVFFDVHHLYSNIASLLPHESVCAVWGSLFFKEKIVFILFQSQFFWHPTKMHPSHAKDLPMSKRPPVELGGPGMKNLWPMSTAPCGETALGPHNPYHFGTAPAGTHAPPGRTLLFGVSPKGWKAIDAIPFCSPQHSWN